jgi:hypothetical protein
MTKTSQSSGVRTLLPTSLWWLAHKTVNWSLNSRALVIRANHEFQRVALSIPKVLPAMQSYSVERIVKL